MISRDMKHYEYYLLNDVDKYGQQTISSDVQGNIKIAIYPTTQNVQDNILYFNAQYIGLTHNKTVNDTYVIQYGDTKLKVLYTCWHGRINQVFMAKME